MAELVSTSIVILGAPDDLIALRVAAECRARGATLHHIDHHGAQPIAWDGESWLLAGVELSAMDGVFVRAVPPRGALLDADPARARTAGEWWRAGLDQLARAEVTEACLRDLAARGRRVVNAPSIHDAKITQLAAFARAGLPIPRTLVSNFGPAARAFADDVDGGEAIIKPVVGGAEARLYAASDERSLAHAPAIVQARAPGVDVRVTVVAGRVVSAVEIPSEGVDYRSGEAYRRGEVVYRPHALTDEGRAIAVRAAEIAGQVLSGVDLRADEGRYVLVEANSAPVYLDIEIKTGAPISAAIAAFLVGE